MGDKYFDGRGLTDSFDEVNGSLELALNFNGGLNRLVFNNDIGPDRPLLTNDFRLHELELLATGTLEVMRHLVAVHTLRTGQLLSRLRPAAVLVAGFPLIGLPLGVEDLLFLRGWRLTVVILLLEQILVLGNR